MSISVVLPAYLEEDNLRVLLPKLRNSLSCIGCEYEVLVVDTMQPMDKSDKICLLNNAIYIPREVSNSYGDAMRTGFKYAEYDYILVMDSDGSHNPEDISRLYNEIKKGYDIIIGSRYIKGGNTNNNIILKLMSKTVNVIYRTIFKLSIKDVSNSFRIYDAKKLKNLVLECDNFDIVEEILIKLSVCYDNLHIKEIPVYFDKRNYGETKRQLLKFIVSYVKTIRHLLDLKAKAQIKMQEKNF